MYNLNLTEAADDADARCKHENAKLSETPKWDESGNCAFKHITGCVGKRNVFEMYQNIVTLSEAKQQQQHVALKGFNKKNKSIRKWYLCRCYCISPFAFFNSQILLFAFPSRLNVHFFFESKPKSERSKRNNNINNVRSRVSKVIFLYLLFRPEVVFENGRNWELKVFSCN